MNTEPEKILSTTISENLCKRQRFFAAEELKCFLLRLLYPPLAGARNGEAVRLLQPRSVRFWLGLCRAAIFEASG